MDENTEVQEFFTIDEAAKEIGWNRATVFQWMSTLEMTKYKFLRNRKTYIASRDVYRLKQVKQKPWLAEAIKKEIEQEKSSIEEVA